VREFFNMTKDILGVHECITRLVGLTEKTKGNWRQVNLQDDGFDHSVELKRLWCRLVELPKSSSVVECKDLQEGGSRFEVLRGKGESLCDYKV
jgi:hypothetical protein